MLGMSSPAFVPSARNLVNVNIPGTEEYPFILLNRFYGVNPQLNGASPFDGFANSPYPQQVDANGYPYTQQASGQNLPCTIQAPSSANFSGPYVLAWDGEGSVGWSNGTWVSANNVTSGTATFNGTTTISFTNSLTANNQRVSFTTSVSGMTAFTVYYVVAATGSTIQIATTPGGSPISISAGTATLQGTFTGTSNSYVNVAGQSAYIILNNSGYNGGAGGFTFGASVSAPATVNTITWTGGVATVTMAAGHKRPIGQTLWLALGGNTTSLASLNGPFLCTITGATTLTFATSDPGTISVVGTMWSYVSNVRVYQLADETSLLAGKTFRTAWLQPYVNLRPSAVRTMNWSGGNVTQLYDFRNRNTPNNQHWGWNAASNWNVGPAYNRPTGYNDWVLPAVTSGTVANPQTTPATIVHGETAQFQIDQSCSMGGGSQIAISSITKASPAVITTTNPHGRFTGDSVWFTITSGMPQLNSAYPSGFKGALVITVTGANTFTVAVDSSAFTTFVAGFFTMVTGATISSISYGSTTTVNTSTNHNFTVGDHAIFSGTGNTGLQGPTNLNALPVVIASVASATQVTFTNLVSGAAYDTTGFPAFVSGRILPYTTLNVKRPGGGDAKFPIAAPSSSYITNPAFMAQGLYKYAIYDATVAFQSDGAGNAIFGAWMMPATSAQNGFITQEVPIEIQVACVLEMNALAVSQGATQKIHLYYCSPTCGIDSTDPGATSQSMWATNALNVIMNGANGYAGLTSAGLTCLVEYSNETWNTTSQGLGPSYLRYRGVSRWTWSNFSTLINDTINITMFRTAAMGIDLGNAFPSLVGNKIIRIMSGAPNSASGAANSSSNYIEWFDSAPAGSSQYYHNDTLVTSGNWGAPGTHLEGTNVAPYVSNSATYYNPATTGTACMNDHYAKYYGVDNSGALSCTGGNGSVAGTTITITASNGTAFVNGQVLIGSGITSASSSTPATYIVSQSGSIPTLVLTLNQNATVANGTTITSPALSGGNYIGAQDQAGGRQGYVTAMVNDSSNGFAYYVTFFTNVSGWLPTGKFLFGYEGAPSWQTLANQGGSGRLQGVRVISGLSTTAGGEQSFLIDCINCAEFGTALVNFFNTCAGLPHVGGGAIYTVNSASANQQQFCFCAPDTYASGVEGQALTNSGSWSAMATRNQALP